MTEAEVVSRVVPVMGLLGAVFIVIGIPLLLVFFLGVPFIFHGWKMLSAAMGGAQPSADSRPHEPASACWAAAAGVNAPRQGRTAMCHRLRDRMGFSQ